jgi:hypothetical protein
MASGTGVANKPANHSTGRMRCRNREGKAQPGQALLTQDYLSHLIWVLAAVAGLCLLAYVVRVVRDHRPDRGRPTGNGPAT